MPETAQVKYSLSAREIIFPIIAIIAIPAKLITEIASYLYNTPIPSATNLALLISFIAVFFGKISQQTDRNTILLFLALIFTMIASLTIQLINPSHKSIFSETAANGIATSVAIYIIYFMAGLNYREGKKIIFNSCLVTLLTCSSIIITTQLAIKDVWISLNETGSYLRIGDALAVTSIIALSIIKRESLKILIIFISIISLVYIGSRSSLFAYSLSISFYLASLLSRKNLTQKKYLPAIAAAFFAITITLYNSEYIQEQFNSSRIGYTLTSSEEKVSGLSTRAELTYRGIDRISENPFFGNFLHRIYDDGSGGQYIHNLLFILDDFGLLAFVVFILIIIKTTFRIIKNHENHHLIPLLTFCLISMLASRAYAFPYIFFLASAAIPNKRTL